MAVVSGWQGGRLNSGLAWTTCFQAADAGTLANGSSVLSSTGDITNGTSLDMFADISFSVTLASNTIAAGANIAFWIYPLNEDGTTYGDNQFVGGTAKAATPSFPSVGAFNNPAVASTTTLVGLIPQLVIPPGTFRFLVQNNCGFTLTAATIKYRSYNINLANTS
jgi:hypothetical protein